MDAIKCPINVVVQRFDHLSPHQGRTFKNLVHDHLKKAGYLSDLLAAYTSAEGKQIYDKCLETCMRKYPLLVEELEGIAKGADVPFYKVS